jgi:hypothetical protein
VLSCLWRAGKQFKANFMSQETSDFIFGAVVLAIFLVFVFVLGWLISKFKNARFAKAWAPLLPIISGTITNDGGGAATSWLAGTYQGRRVRASMTPDRNRYSGESDPKYNHFDVALLDVPGRQDWSVVYKTPVLGFGEHGWRIQTEDKALEARLLAAGVMQLITRLGCDALAYQAKAQTLACEQDVTPRWVPTPERFRADLESLILLAQVNEQVNTV